MQEYLAEKQDLTDDITAVEELLQGIEASLGASVEHTNTLEAELHKQSQRCLELQATSLKELSQFNALKASLTTEIEGVARLQQSAHESEQQVSAVGVHAGTFQPPPL